VIVTRSSGDPGSGTYINIRGFKTITGGNQPLFVVDGTPVNNDTRTIEDTRWGTAVQNRAADINPDDIASIEILKGPAGSAIYGSAGANGVILITTKSGARTNTVQANVRFAYNTDRVTEFNDLQTTYGQGLFGDPIPTFLTWGPELDPSTPIYDHGGEVFQNGSGFDVNATVSGGDSQTTYFFSGGYVRQNGVTRGDNKLDRFNFRLKASQQFLASLSLSGNVAYTNQQADLIQQGSNLSGLLVGALRTPPEFNNIPHIDPETGLHRSFRCETGVQGPNCTTDPSVSRGFDNPFWIANEIDNTAKVDRMFGNIRIDWDPFHWLNVSNIFGVDYSNDDRFTLFPKSSSVFPDGRVIRASLNQFDLDNSLFLTASGSLSDDLLAQITAGQNLRQTEFQRFQVMGDELILGGRDLEQTVDRSSVEFQSQVRTAGYFADVNIDFADQLFIQGGVRYDGWSTFGGDQQWFWFPSGSLAWEFTRLMGTESNSAFNFGRIRVAYGEAGQDPPVYSNISGFVTTFRSNYLDQEGLSTETSLANSDIGPERTREFEAGLDLAFVDSRVSLGVVWYDQKTEDAILELPVPSSLGFDTQPRNGAEFRNRGWEFQLGLIPFRGRRFTWEIDAHGGTIDSEVLDLQAEEFFLDGFSSLSASVVKDICGPAANEPCPFGVLFGDDLVKFGRGLNADVDCNPSTPNSSIDEAYPEATPGALYIGCDGYPFSDPRPRVLGDPNPDWNGGVRNTFTVLENLRISALVDWRSGIDMWNGTKGALFLFGTHKENEEWHGDGQPWVFEGFGPGAGEEVVRDALWALAGAGSGFTGGTQFFIERASFVKLRDVSLRYTVNGGPVTRWLGFARAEFSFTGRNLITWTDYTGLDPESNFTGQGNARGLEYFNNPRIRSYVFQVNLVR
jgi:TonB-linked SusC/RagA family outer membrane protein